MSGLRTGRRTPMPITIEVQELVDDPDDHGHVKKTSRVSTGLLGGQDLKLGLFLDTRYRVRQLRFDGNNCTNITDMPEWTSLLRAHRWYMPPSAGRDWELFVVPEGLPPQFTSVFRLTRPEEPELRIPLVAIHATNVDTEQELRRRFRQGEFAEGASVVRRPNEAMTNE
jgi:hypothetical protein